MQTYTNNNECNDCHISDSTHRCLRSSCKYGRCKAGPGLQFSRLTPTPPKRKKTKSVNILKKNILTQSNNNKDIYSVEESVEELQKCQTYGFESYKQKLIEEPINKSHENSFCNENKFETSLKSNNLFNELIQLFSKALKLSQTSDFIHERYLQYLRLTPTQKDSSKTDYTYIHSFSYNKYIDSSKLLEWDVPNMSRRTVSSMKTTSTTTVSNIETSNNSKSSSVSASLTSSVREGRGSSQSSEIRSRTPTAHMFTRSQCLGGTQCEAPGCLLHKKMHRKKLTKEGIVIPNSGHGLEPEIEFSEEEDDYTINNRLNNQRLTNYRQNGFSYQRQESEEEEDITIIRRVTNIFRTTINNTSRIIESFTPNTVKRVANKCPSLWLLLSLLLFLVPLVYFMSQHKSSLWSDNSFESLTGDMSSKNAINQLIKEIKSMKSDIQSLKETNNGAINHLKESMKDNELNGNEKLNHLNTKIDSIEEYLNNIMKNCCKNETDSVLALIDLRLSSFMASMLNDNQNNEQLMTASEAAEELKRFIRLELSKSNERFKENIELKLMSTIERVEHKISHKSEDISSNITIDEIKSLISQALAIYDADKTGQPDFALEPAGGTIVNTRCSETFDPYGVQYKIFGMPVWSSSISPRAVIQPTISPGECWAFKGSNGYLVIKLSQPIIPSAFSYEHIPKQISRDGNIDSAPKEFQVRGLDDESDTSGHLLGNYIYEDNGRPMQYFEVQDPNPRVFQFIELVILSNHGHNDYTCLYRFRVHGKRVNH